MVDIADTAAPEPNGAASKRTLRQARLDLDYEIEVTSRHATFYRLLKRVLGFVGLCGIAAIFKDLDKSSVLSAIGSGVTFAAFAAELWFAPGESAATFDAMNRRFKTLKTKAQPMTVEQLDQAMSEIEVDKPPEIWSLRVVAYHANLRAQGLESHIRKEREKPWHRFMDLLS